MSKRSTVRYETTKHVRDRCLCLAAQRTARVLARRFDEAFRPLALTSGQFSLLMSLNRPQPAKIGEVAALLAMDRSTVTANLKPLQARGLLDTEVDPADRRGRLLTLTAAGQRLLAAAVPIWEREHDRTEASLARAADALRSDLRALI